MGIETFTNFEIQDHYIEVLQTVIGGTTIGGASLAGIRAYAKSKENNPDGLKAIRDSIRELEKKIPRDSFLFFTNHIYLARLTPLKKGHQVSLLALDLRLATKLFYD